MMSAAAGIAQRFCSFKIRPQVSSSILPALCSRHLIAPRQNMTQTEGTGNLTRQDVPLAMPDMMSDSNIVAYDDVMKIAEFKS